MICHTLIGYYSNYVPPNMHINCKTYTIVTLANTHDFFKFGIHTKHDTKLDKWIS